MIRPRIAFCPWTGLVVYAGILNFGDTIDLMQLEMLLKKVASLETASI